MAAGVGVFMKKLLLTVLAACALAAAVLVLPGTSAQDVEAETPPPGRERWVLRSLGEMNKVKVGMTRADLLEVFGEEGGISTRTQRRYVYKDCRYFKVDVKFEPVGEAGEPFGESPEDKIKEISKPYIDYGITD